MSGEHGKAKIAWDQVASPKEEGGMGLLDLVTWNVVASGRHIWLILLQGGSFWVAWLRRHRLNTQDFWQYNGALGSWIWRKILKLRSWFQFRMYVEEDSVYWEGRLLHKYSVKVIWEGIREMKPRIPWYSLLWGKYSIPKHRFIAWLTIINRIVTMDNLLVWGKVVDARCVFCQSSQESRDHLFVQCGFFAGSANDIFRFLAPTWRSWEEMLDFMCCLCTKPKARSKVGSFFWTVWISLLWRTRCARIYGKRVKSIAAVRHEFCQDILFYATGNRKFAEEVACFHTIVLVAA